MSVASLTCCIVCVDVYEQIKAVSQPGKYSKYRSMHGSYINFNCDKNLVVSDPTSTSQTHLHIQQGFIQLKLLRSYYKVLQLTVLFF